MTVNRTDKQLTGRIGETLAVGYLQLKGYQILRRNWKYRRLEIDLITRKGNTVHFTEVKTRRTLRFGWPEDHIKRKKIIRMMIAVDAYMQSEEQSSTVQIDILSVYLPEGKSPEFWLIEDVYL